MMHDREKSDPTIVAGKPTNKAGQPAAELVESQGWGPRGTRAGKAHTGHSTGNVCHKRWNAYGGLARTQQPAVTHPRWEPYAGKPHVRIYAGGTR